MRWTSDFVATERHPHRAADLLGSTSGAARRASRRGLCAVLGGHTTTRWRPSSRLPARTSPIDDGSMIATVDVADMGILSTLRALRRRPTPIDVPGLRWLDVAPTVPLSSKRPPGLRQAVLLAMWMTRTPPLRSWTHIRSPSFSRTTASTPSCVRYGRSEPGPVCRTTCRVRG